MSERNAKLLRRFIKFCGPGRLPERITVDVAYGKERTVVSDKTRPNPIIADMREVFRRGTSGQKRALAAQFRQEIGLKAFPRRARRARNRDMVKERISITDWLRKTAEVIG